MAAEAEGTLYYCSLCHQLTPHYHTPITTPVVDNSRVASPTAVTAPSSPVSRQSDTSVRSENSSFTISPPPSVPDPPSNPPLMRGLTDPLAVVELRVCVAGQLHFIAEQHRYAATQKATIGLLNHKMEYLTEIAKTASKDVLRLNVLLQEIGSDPSVE